MCHVGDVQVENDNIIEYWK